MTGKQRLDVVLVERGLAPSRTRAQALVHAGKVVVDDKRVDKPGTPIRADAQVRVRGDDNPYVSRGGLKLAAALRGFTGLRVAQRVAMDVGASTGGFTDVLLQGGAAKVYAVDVGQGQLAWSLRQDPRVVVLERCNARYLTEAQIPEPPALVVCDASFISLTLVLPAALALAAPEARLIALIKPQFEVGKGAVGKGGIVRDPAQHAAVCAKIGAFLEKDQGWELLGMTESPITGPDGNREFLVAAGKPRP